MQYCMGTPRHLLQGSRYSNLTTARLSEDIFERSRWDEFLYASRLASALGVWPWTDVFESADGLLLAVLSAGVVGVGTELGQIDARALLGAARPDGILVKPDVPLSPTDDTILKDASHAAGPLVASTFTDHGNGVRTFYVFAVARAAETKAVVDTARLGLGTSFYAWDALLGSGHPAGAGDHLEMPLVDGRAYHVVAPIGPSGLAFLGDEGKLVPLGKKRIAALADDGILRVTVSFAEGEREVVLRGWAPAQPVLLGHRGSSSPVEYDEVTGLFRLSVSPGPGNVARVRLRLAGSGAVLDQGSRFEN
jgi:hypothetical protein